MKKSVIWSALILMLCVGIVPLHAMNMNEREIIDARSLSIDIRQVRNGIHEVIIGCDDANDAVYASGIQNIQTKQRRLHAFTFQDLGIFPSFEPHFLKILTIKGEHRLLSDFLDMYHRSYPERTSGINFLYTVALESDGKSIRSAAKKKEMQYTLLDVAHTAYIAARAEGKPAETESQILRLLINQGGETFENLSKPKWTFI
jgi:hypothetical protein